MEADTETRYIEPVGSALADCRLFMAQLQFNPG
jgi:hypothetical protein